MFVHYLSLNPIVRAYPIAKALQLLGHEVEILGLTYYSDKVYEPYKDEFEYKTIQSHEDIRWVIINSRKLAKMATGDVVYCFKPVWGTFFPALLYSWFGLKKRLILDAEDNELWDPFIGNGIRELGVKKYYPLNPVYNKLLHPFTWFVKRKTIVCSQLQKRYGGKIILHGPMAEKFNPLNYPEANVIRDQYALPHDVPLLLFAGKPVYYNGLPIVIETLTLPEAQNWHLVLAGDVKNEVFQQAKIVLKERCHLLGFIPNSDMPLLLKMVDVVPIIQTPIPSTQMQIPAKMLEAMSMAKGIITTNVSDMNIIIGNDRGWIIAHDDKMEFAKVLHYIHQHREILLERGKNARNYFLQNASIEIIASRIKEYFN